MSKGKVFIFLHGYDSCGNDMMILDSVFKKIVPKDSLFLYPNAPFKTHNGKGYNWFSFVFGEDPFNINEEYIFQSMQQVLPYIKRYIFEKVDFKLFSMQDIFLVGFSQGAGLALHTSMRLGEPICGAISFSGGLANPNNEIKREEEQKNKSPVCFIHGEDDKILPYKFSERGHKMMLDAGFKSEFHLLQNTSHIITPQAMEIAGNFIKQVIV